MPLTDRTLLFDSAAGVSAHVEPVVLFAILDHYSRRDEGQDFVVGSLLGTEEGGIVTICSSFPVPYSEAEDSGAYYLNSDFHATMLSLQQRVTPKQKVVGWYCTGERINQTTTLFHNHYAQDVERPVHLLFDLGLGERRMSTKAYVSAGLTLGDARVATAFREVEVCTPRRAPPARRVRGQSVGWRRLTPRRSRPACCARRAAHRRERRVGPRGRRHAAQDGQRQRERGDSRVQVGHGSGRGGGEREEIAADAGGCARGCARGCAPLPPRARPPPTTAHRARGARVPQA